MKRQAVDYRQTVIETYTCPSCGAELEVYRTKGTRREKGHLKSMYCPFCDKENNFIYETN